jgi:hypothetical protein
MKLLLKFSLIISFAGIFSLLILSYFHASKIIVSSQIGFQKDGALISISGKVIKETLLAENFKSLIIMDRYGTAEVVCSFCGESAYYGKNATIYGKISTYKEKTQVSADRIITD